MAFKVLKKHYPSLLASWKFLLSFRKKKWRLEDYPILLRKQGDFSQPIGKAGRWTRHAYSAQIVNWTLSGSGETAQAAMESLGERFDRARESGPSMPRPGTRVPLEFASQERIAANSALAVEFMQIVLGHNEAWITDESSLWDFTLEDSLDIYYARIRAVYGLDLSGIADESIAEILERIAESKQRVMEPHGHL